MLSPIAIVSLNQGKAFAADPFRAEGDYPVAAVKQAMVGRRARRFIEVVMSLVTVGRRWTGVRTVG
jgi:hypothetical protein